MAGTPVAVVVPTEPRPRIIVTVAGKPMVQRTPEQLAALAEDTAKRNGRWKKAKAEEMAKDAKKDEEMAKSVEATRAPGQHHMDILYAMLVMAQQQSNLAAIMAVASTTVFISLVSLLVGRPPRVHAPGSGSSPVYGWATTNQSPPHTHTLALRRLNGGRHLDAIRGCGAAHQPQRGAHGWLLTRYATEGLTVAIRARGTRGPRVVRSIAYPDAGETGLLQLSSRHHGEHDNW